MVNFDLIICAALRGVATLKARAMKEVWNIASVIPMDKGITSTGGCSNVHNGSNGSSSSSHSGELTQPENFLGTCSREWLARGCELLKRTRKGKTMSCIVYILVLLSNDFVLLFTGDLHWKIVSVYINKMNQVKVYFPLVSRDLFTLGDDR